MFSENGYGGLMEPRDLGLVTKWARSFGFRDDELPDLEQEIAVELIGAPFSADGSASRRTFVASVIGRQLKRVLRNRRRDKRRINFEACPLEAVGEDSLPSVDGIERLCLRLDLQDALDRLSPEDRSICASLLRGESQAEIARARGVSRAAVHKRVAKLAEGLRRRGLGPCRRKSRDSGLQRHENGK